MPESDGGKEIVGDKGVTATRGSPISSSTPQFEDRVMVWIGFPITWWIENAWLRTSNPCFRSTHGMSRA